MLHLDLTILSAVLGAEAGAVATILYRMEVPMEEEEEVRLSGCGK